MEHVVFPRTILDSCGDYDGVTVRGMSFFVPNDVECPWCQLTVLRRPGIGFHKHQRQVYSEHARGVVNPVLLSYPQILGIWLVILDFSVSCC